jgi:hypothetical protein
MVTNEPRSLVVRFFQGVLAFHELQAFHYEGCEISTADYSISDDLGRTSENLVTSADAGTDLVVLRLRVTETVKLGLGDKSVKVMRSPGTMETRTYQGRHEGPSEPDGISLAFVADHVDLDTGRLQSEI